MTIKSVDVIQPTLAWGSVGLFSLVLDGAVCRSASERNVKTDHALRPVDWSGNRFCFDVCDNKVGQLMDVKAVGL